MCDGGDTMDDKQQQPQSEERRGESTLLKLHEEFHQFMQECRDCRREIEDTGNSAPTAGYGWPRTAQAAATRCPRSGRMPPRCGVALPPVQP